MNRDPNYYLDRAEYFNKLAHSNGYKPPQYDNLEDQENLEDDYEYEYVKLEPTIQTQNSEPTSLLVKPQYQRYYDPTTKHWYKTDQIFTTDANVIKNPPITVKNPAVWYPENKLSYKYMRDPSTGRFYRVNKKYDENGNYSFDFKKLNYKPIKQPGTNYYKPNYFNI